VRHQPSGPKEGSQLRRLSRFHCLLALQIIFAQPLSAQVAVSLCQGAKVNFAKAVTEVQERLKGYADCVAGTQGAEDCGSEFRRLRTAQGSLETAAMQRRTWAVLRIAPREIPAPPPRPRS
jgi:hypothetical protein